MKHKLESKLEGEISVTSDMQMTLPLWQIAEELKSLLVNMKEESEKADLKLSIQKLKIITSGPTLSWQIDGNNRNSDRLFCWAPKSLQVVIIALKLKDTCSLEQKQ